MDFLLIVVVMGGTFGLCWLLDKGFTKTFRSKKEHQSGLSVRLSSKYGAFGLILSVVGIAAIFMGLSDSTLLIVGGALVLALGAGLVIYYMTFGVFYDSEGFILTTFGKKSQTYRFGDIRSQQLFVSYGTVVIELYLSDGRSVQLQSAMSGVYPFLDTAFAGWLSQTGRKKEDCDFYDPDNSCWFPAMEG